jgi:thioredoxin 1
VARAARSRLSWTRSSKASNGQVTLMKLNVDESPLLAMRYGIRLIPTILFITDGPVVDRVVGAVSNVVLQRHLERAHRGS